MDQLTGALVTIFTGIIGVAFLAVLVSKNSNTSTVITAGGNAFSGDLGTALSPITGGGSMNFSAPSFTLG